MNSKKLFVAISCFGIVFLTFQISAQNKERVSSYINPFIGTKVVESYVCGNTFPGACAPFGLVQLSPDTRKKMEKGYDYLPSGYDYNRTRITGFSHTHLSGTGAQDLYDIQMMPSCQELNDLSKSNDFSSSFSHQKEKASAGYYRVELDNGILVELTATTHTGMHRYTYPKDGNKSLIIDMSNSEKNYWTWNHTHGVFDAQIRMIDSTTLTGFRILDGWQRMRKVYFYAKFSSPIKHIVMKSNGIYYHDGHIANGPDACCFLSFNDVSNPLIVKVAISPISSENAKNNMEENTGWDFDSIRQQTVEAWEKELSNIHVEGTLDQKTIFYTGLYHAYIQPNAFSDCNGEYMKTDYTIGQLMKGEINYSTFSFWDTYRAVHPLYTILKQDRVKDMINSMLREYDTFGILPIWQLWGTENYGMIGNHAIIILVDAALKHIPGVDLEKVYEAVRGTSVTDHPNSPFTMLEKYGYIPYNLLNQSVSITQDIAYDDACVARLAKILNKTPDYAYFNKRAQFYRNLYDYKTGFFRPKDDKGQWMVPFDPVKYGVTFNFPYTECNPWQVEFNAPYDIEGMIELLGGKDAFEKKLDKFFTMITPYDENSGLGGYIGQYTHGNETAHHSVYLYDFIGKPAKTQYYVNKVLTEQYTNNPAGYTGNDDCGQMSCWYVFSAIGFYPVDAASGIYAFGSPQFKKVTIDLPNGKTFVIKSNRSSPKQMYIKSVKMNGKVYKKLYISHADIMNGGILEFEMRE